MADSGGLTYGSLCSGIEATTVAWQALGWSPLFFSETATFPCALLAHHYPGVPNAGDITQLAQRIPDGEIPAPDILAGGTPCQAFSVSGKRQGIGDARGALTLSFVRIADALDASRQARGLAPSIIIWENVPGVLCDKNNAFGCFLAALAGESRALQPAGKKWTGAGAVSGSARDIAWRVLDAQYFGLPQQRLRVFVVASARADIDPGAILFDPGTVRPGITDLSQGKATPPPGAGACPEMPGTAGTLLAGYHKLNNQSVLMRGGLIPDGDRVRRLSPVECERLQGFPDNYTDIPWKTKSPVQRYIALGNAMPVPVMRWIGERVDQAVAASRANASPVYTTQEKTNAHDTINRYPRLAAAHRRQYGLHYPDTV